MAITLGSNISALRTTRQLERATSGLASVSERLASGQRINKASDDAAGLSIASTLDATSRVFTKALANVNDGISLLSIADGAAQSLGSILTRIRELATQSANGSYSAVQRRALDEEAQKQRDEYNRILATTQFNGVKMLDGSQSTINLQVGVDGTSAPLAMSAPNLGTDSASGSTGSLSFDGVNDYVALGGQIGGLSDTTNYTLSLWYKGTDSGVGNSVSGKTLAGRDNGDIYANFTLNGGHVEFVHYNSAWLHNIRSTTYVADDQWHHAVYVNHSNETGDLYIDGNLEVSGASSSISDDNYPFRIDNLMRGHNGQFTSGNLDDVRVYTRALSSSEITTLKNGGDPSSTGLTAHFKIDEGLGATTIDSAGGIIGTLTGGASWSSDSAPLSLSQLSTFSLLTATDARGAMDTIETAFARLNTEVGKIGSQLSRLQSVVSTIATARENYQAASGRIKDADVAQESAALTRFQILQQTASSVLAQANQQPRIALQLLGAV